MTLRWVSYARLEYRTLGIPDHCCLPCKSNNGKLFTLQFGPQSARFKRAFPPEGEWVKFTMQLILWGRGGVVPHSLLPHRNFVTSTQPPICHQYEMAPVDTLHRIDWDRQLRRLNRGLSAVQHFKNYLSVYCAIYFFPLPLHFPCPLPLLPSSSVVLAGTKHRQILTDWHWVLHFQTALLLQFFVFFFFSILLSFLLLHFSNLGNIPQSSHSAFPLFY